MIDLRVRSRTEEQMDDPGIAPEVYAAVLADLARVNRWTLTVRPVIGFLGRVVRDGETVKSVRAELVEVRPARSATSASGELGMPFDKLRANGNGNPYRILDVGFGHGDTLRAIARWAAKRGIAVDLIGVDLNPLSADIARAATDPALPIRYRTGDYADQPEAFDVIISNQVAHHMSDAQLDGFIRFMEERARIGWMIGDLHRHRIAHSGYPWLARLLGVHRIVREDGRLSIARSFRRAEWRDILTRAGVAEAAAAIRWYMPFRLCVERAR